MAASLCARRAQLAQQRAHSSPITRIQLALTRMPTRLARARARFVCTFGARSIYLALTLAPCSCCIVFVTEIHTHIMLSIAAMSSTTFAGLAAKAPMPVQMKAFDGLSYANSMAGIMPAETPGGDVGVFDPAGFLKQDNLTEEKVLFYREVELKHGRLAM